MKPPSARSAAENKARRRPDSPEPYRRIVLQRRDIALLADVYAHGSMLRGQIQELHFGSVPRANARLRQLYDARYLQRAELSLPTELDQATGCQLAYLLGPAGIPLVASELGIEASEVRRQLRRGTPDYLLHTIEIVRFRRSVETAARSCDDVVLERFLPERLCRHAYEVREKLVEGNRGDPRWRLEIFKPDAVFFVTQGGKRMGFAVEIDRGHTSASEFALKLAIHGRYVSAGLYENRYGARYAGTLIVTTSPKRRQNLATIAARAASGTYYLTTFAEVRTMGAFGPTWYKPSDTQARGLW